MPISFVSSIRNILLCIDVHGYRMKYALRPKFATVTSIGVEW